MHGTRLPRSHQRRQAEREAEQYAQRLVPPYRVNAGIAAAMGIRVCPALGSAVHSVLSRAHAISTFPAQTYSNAPRERRFLYAERSWDAGVKSRTTPFRRASSHVLNDI